jgi:SAGA-associated factor 73
MAALARHKPRPLATYTHVSQRSKYQYIRMKDMIRSALGAPPGGSPFGNHPSATDGMNRGLSLGMMGAPPSTTSENFPGSAGMGGFPMSAGLDGNMGRRQSGMGMSNGGNGPRQILPGQLPGPGGQRKSSLSVGGS